MNSELVNLNVYAEYKSKINTYCYLPFQIQFTVLMKMKEVGSCKNVLHSDRYVSPNLIQVELKSVWDNLELAWVDLKSFLT